MKHTFFDLDPAGSSRLNCVIADLSNGNPSPAFLWIPGGGFNVCATEVGTPIILSLAMHGYSVFSMNYPVGESYLFPDVLVLVSKAIQLIRAHAAEWNVDTNRIVIGGGSAGGFISAAYAAFWNHPRMQELTGCKNGENRPNALLTQNGLFHTYQQTAEGTKKVCVYNHVGKDMPPAFLLHAADDTLVSVDQTLAMAWNMNRAGKPFSLFISDSGSHSGLQNSKRTIVDTGKLSPGVDDWMPAALLFLDNVLGVAPEYEKCSMPGPSGPPIGDGPSGQTTAPSGDKMLKMHTGSYESGMVWGFCEN